MNAKQAQKIPLSKSGLADLYNCDFRTLKKRLQEKGLEIPKEKRIFFANEIRQVFELIGRPSNCNLSV